MRMERAGIGAVLFNKLNGSEYLICKVDQEKDVAYADRILERIPELKVDTTDQVLISQKNAICKQQDLKFTSRNILNELRSYDVLVDITKENHKKILTFADHSYNTKTISIEETNDRGQIVKLVDIPFCF